MAIFNCYVSSPEGNCISSHFQVGERRFFVGPRGDDAQNAGRAAGASGRGDLQISGAGAGSETIFSRSILHGFV